MKVWCTDSGAVSMLRYNRYGENPEQVKLRSKSGTLKLDPNYSLGYSPVGDLALTGYIGKEVSMYCYQILAVDWYPLSITKIDWSGQYFNNQGRV